MLLPAFSMFSQKVNLETKSIPSIRLSIKVILITFFSDHSTFLICLYNTHELSTTFYFFFMENQTSCLIASQTFVVHLCIRSQALGSALKII